MTRSRIILGLLHFGTWLNYCNPLFLQNNRAAQIAFHKPIAEYLDDAIKQVLRDKPKDEIKIMDAGAGTGNVGVELSKLGYTNLHALDISQEMLHEAKKKNVYKKVFCAALNDQRIPEIDTGEFDVLVCCGTLVKGHAHSDAFVEMIRMVKIGMFFWLFWLIFAIVWCLSSSSVQSRWW